MPFDFDAIQQDLERIFGLGEFEKASFELEPGSAPGSRVLVLRLTEKSWGPNFLQQSVQIFGDFEGGAELGFLANLTKTQITRRGGEWRTDLLVGTREGALTELYFPLDWPGHFFVSASASWIADEQETPVGEERRNATFEVETAAASFDFGLRLGQVGELRLGLQRTRLEGELDFAGEIFPFPSFHTGGFQLQLAVDTLDAPTVPRRGLLFGLSLQLQREDFGADTSYDRLEASGNGFASFGDHTLVLGMDVGTNLGSTLPLFDEFAIGGLFTLSGYSDGEIRGQRYGLGRLIYYYRLLDLPSTFGRGFYVGGALEAGNVWNEEIDLDDLRSSVTVFLMADTILGPIFAGYGVSDESTEQVYLSVGRTF